MRFASRMKIRWLSLLTAAIFFPFRLQGQVEKPINYNRDIRPILSNHCFACHGPDENKREADLRLDLPGIALEKKAIIPGDAQSSQLIQRVRHEQPNKRMPPEETKKPLTKVKIDLLERWIASGAEYDEHWAWIPPVRFTLPETSSPEWVINPIDSFVLAQLKKENPSLHPSGPADARRLIRRLSFDLTGLPPSTAEISAFLEDHSPRAYENLVARLLASDSFGERMAMHWLDLARYADSDGYHDDTDRAMWPYRDYVINSFNNNKPFDIFTREQIAGDLIPDATLEQKSGSAFHRNGPTSSEGGANPEEYRVKYAVDRVATTATVWLGVTLQCAECHDHKYDPFSQREFYQMFAFFDQVPGNPLYRGKFAPPSIALPSPQQEAEKKKWSQQIEILQAGSTKSASNVNKNVVLELEMAKKNLQAITRSIPKLRIMQDADERMPSHILIRGNFRRRGELVSPAVPSIFPDLPPAASPRLALAEWLSDPGNPLPARVVVNRLWAMLFGEGIVTTLQDFGSQGDWPSHPKLLDWLAVEFIESGWDIKHMLTLMVTSATYRQSSAGSEMLMQIDPSNRLLARGSRRRLSAEMIRDNALFVSGLLYSQMGGPSVKPHQPPGLWKEMAYGDSKGKSYITDQGKNLYRRGLYTFWKRSILYPAFAAFDAPNREECVVNRPITNTPLQALVTMNDRTFVEAARAFAKRILESSNHTEESRITFAVESALYRPPSDQELFILISLQRDMISHYKSHSEDAGQIVSAGKLQYASDFNTAELAAWIAVAQAIMNLDEFLTKE